MKASTPLRLGTLPLALAGLALASAPASAQSAQMLLSRGQAIPTVGNITSIDKFAINDNGDWLAVVVTNAPANKDTIVLRNGFVTLREGTVLGAPAGATFTAPRSLNVDSRGNIFWDLELTPAGGSTTITGVYFNTRKQFVEVDPISTPGYSRAAFWLKFNGAVKANDSNQFMVGATVSDPSIAGASDDALLLFTTDGKGNIISSTDVAHEDGSVPELPYKITTGAPGLAFSQVTDFDLNDKGDVMWQARYTISGTNRARGIFLNDKLLANEGAASPIAGLNWNDLTSRVSLNDRGDYAFEAGLTGPQNQRAVLVKNGQIFLRERTSFPAIAPYLIDNFADKTPILLSNTGEVVYRCQWTGPNATDTGILVDKEIVVQENTTQINGLLVSIFVDSPDAIAISPNGRYLLYRVDLEDESSVVGITDLGRVTPLDDCTGNTGRLFRSKGFPVIGKTVTLSLDKGQGVGVTPFLLVSDRAIAGYPPCGIATGFGELVIDFGTNGNPFLIRIGNPWLGGPVPINLAIANSVGLVDKKVYAQGIFFNVGNNIPGVETLRLTNAVEIEIGSP